jgi:hypothetical protein
VANNTRHSNWGFGWGLIIGSTLALVALLGTPAGSLADPGRGDLAMWLNTNLGHSIWLFAIVGVLFTTTLVRLLTLLDESHPPQPQEVIALDQMSDIWTQVFIGIGVIWTAVGMRSALQSALGDATTTLTSGADDVLRRLVDGGILVALTTTIVGAVGGYLMRLIKTIFAGPALQRHYDAQSQQDIRALLNTTQRIEAQLASHKDPDQISRLADQPGQRRAVSNVLSETAP